MLNKYYCILLHQNNDLEKHILPKSTENVIFIHGSEEFKICTKYDKVILAYRLTNIYN